LRVRITLFDNIDVHIYIALFGEFQTVVDQIGQHLHNFGLVTLHHIRNSRVNIQPELQRDVRRQSSASFAALDSMNLWIDKARDSLVAAIGEVDCLLLNDAELRMLTGRPNLVQAARAAIELGPEVVVAKRGEYGAALFTSDGSFAIPGLPLEDVCDPTGAGDSFAGGFLGYLDAVRVNGVHDERSIRQAMAYGSVMASFNVEDFGTERLRRLTEAEIAGRLSAFKRLTHFEETPFTR
jgi:sugar/nucleoside kinase (ribokinase family)